MSRGRGREVLISRTARTIIERCNFISHHPVPLTGKRTNTEPHSKGAHRKFVG